MACSVSVVIALAFVAQVALVDAGSFLMRKDFVEQFALLELSSIAGNPEVRSVEESLRPLYAALPKNSKGELEPSVVRYAAHRYFEHKYGWHVKGLQHGGETWNASSPLGASIMKQQMPAYIQSVFEQRLQSGGLGLQELAAFIVTISDLIRQDVVGVLSHVYDAMGLSQSVPQQPDSFDSIIDLYLALHINGTDGEEDLTRSYIMDVKDDAVQVFLDWVDSQMWSLDLRHTLDHTQQSRRNPFKTGVDFNHAAEFVLELAHRFGSTQDLHCRLLKERLVDMEDQGTGRVPLSKFYSGYKDTTWPFWETVSYLRAQGALDEANPRMPSVIIPNYIGGSGMCLQPSGFYSVCCLNECEGLMTHVESMVTGPTTTSARIAEIVSGLPSATVEAPRNLSATHLHRLDQIAEHHGGHVPLHGRLFAQWMHHAYPRECPFPHISGTTKPLVVTDWEREQGALSHEATDEEMEVYLRDGEQDARMLEAAPEDLPWTAVEELVSSEHAKLASGGSGAWSSLRAAALLAAVAFAVLPAARASKSTWSSTSAEKQWV